MKTKALLTLVLISLCGLFAALPLAAQDAKVRVSGKVTDPGGNPLPGALILESGTSNAIAADDDGGFVLNVLPSAILDVTYLGYSPISVAVGNRTSLDIELQQDGILVDDVVVVGYGTLRRKDVTGSVSSLDKTILEERSVTNVAEYLRGTIAGLNTAVSNSPSGASSFQIRGPNSLQASTSPLIVLDGVIYYGSLSDVDPATIEAIDVLKDASSTAIYGARGAAGVIMLTTKRGKTGHPTISFTANFGFTQVADNEKVYSPEGYVNTRKDYHKTQNFYATGTAKKPEGYYDNPASLPTGITKEQWAAYDPAFSGDYVSTWLNRLQLTPIEVENYLAGKTINWMDQTLRTGFRQDYNATVSGGAKSVDYMFSMGYTDNNDYRLGNEWNNVRMRINLESKMAKWLTVGTNTQMGYRKTDSEMVDMTNAVYASPYGNMWAEDGLMEWYPSGEKMAPNPLMHTDYKEVFIRNQTLFSNIFARITLPFGIEYQVNWLNRFGWSKDYSFLPDVLPGIEEGGRASRDDSSSYEWMLEHILKWNRTFGSHRIDATFVAGAEKSQGWGSVMGNNGFYPNGNLSYHGMSAGSKPTVSSNDFVQTGTSMLGRVNYSFMDRYILTASFRRDGYSGFGRYDPYGNFPSVAVAWRISEEGFFRNSVVNDMKLRAAWGVNGNRDFGRYAALAKITTSKNIINGETVTGIYPSSLANSALQWEQTESLNFGLDFGLLKNRISGTVEYYTAKTTNLLLDRTLPNIIGYESVSANLGELRNRGFEITLNSRNFIRSNFKWNTTFIMSHNRNEIVHLYGDMVDVLDKEGNVIGRREGDDVTNGWYIGRGIDDIYGFKFIGIWQIGEEEEAAKYGMRPGDPKLLDVNEDGVLDSDNDKVWQGRNQPRYRVSLRNDFTIFKRWNVSFLFAGMFGYYGAYTNAKNGPGRYYDRRNNYVNDYWTPDNPINDHTALGANVSSYSFNVYRRRDFVRLQDVSVSYSFPQKLLKPIGAAGLRLSFNLTNAFSISDWPYFDPESISRIPRIYTFGLSLTL